MNYQPAVYGIFQSSGTKETVFLKNYLYQKWQNLSFFFFTDKGSLDRSHYA